MSSVGTTDRLFQPSERSSFRRSAFREQYQPRGPYARTGRRLESGRGSDMATIRRAATFRNRPRCLTREPLRVGRYAHNTHITPSARAVRKQTHEPVSFYAAPHAIVAVITLSVPRARHVHTSSGRRESNVWTVGAPQKTVDRLRQCILWGIFTGRQKMFSQNSQCMKYHSTIIVLRVRFALFRVIPKYCQQSIIAGRHLCDDLAVRLNDRFVR